MGSPIPVSPLSSLPASDPPLDDSSESLEGDLDGGLGSKIGASRDGGGEGDGTPTPGLCRSPNPCRYGSKKASLLQIDYTAQLDLR